MRSAPLAVAVAAALALATCQQPDGASRMEPAPGGKTWAVSNGGRPAIVVEGGGGRWTLEGLCRVRGLIRVEVELAAGAAPVAFAPAEFALRTPSTVYQLVAVNDVTGIDLGRGGPQPPHRELFNVDRSSPASAAQIVAAPRQRRSLLVMFAQPEREADAPAPGMGLTFTIPTSPTATVAALRCAERGLLPL